MENTNNNTSSVLQYALFTLIGVVIGIFLTLQFFPRIEHTYTTEKIYQTEYDTHYTAGKIVEKNKVEIHYADSFKLDSNSIKEYLKQFFTKKEHDDTLQNDSLIFARLKEKTFMGSVYDREFISKINAPLVTNTTTHTTVIENNNKGLLAGVDIGLNLVAPNVGYQFNSGTIVSVGYNLVQDKDFTTSKSPTVVVSIKQPLNKLLKRKKQK